MWVWVNARYLLQIWHDRCSARALLATQQRRWSRDDVTRLPGSCNVFTYVSSKHLRHGASSLLCPTGFNRMSPVTAPVMSIIPAWSHQHGVFELHLHPGQRHRFVNTPSVVLCAASWRLSICALLSTFINAVVTSQLESVCSSLIGGCDYDKMWFISWDLYPKEKV